MTQEPRYLADRYEVRSLIGSGGMAEVHLGYDRRLSRTVAIKMLRLDLARDHIFQARFRREAQAAASLNHPAIVAVYDTGEQTITAPDGSTVEVPYIVMEHVQGSTVRDLLQEGIPIPINEAIEIVSGVLAALDYSHHSGLVHRDIKPGNVMLTCDGKVKVMDFGIARAMTDSQSTMTATDAVVGTAQYLSPEQARGETVDSRSDLYSTGCLFFELLTGRPPFKADSAVAVAYQHVSEAPPIPSSIAPDIPEAIDRIVLKALAKNRDDRYPSASQMRRDLAAVARGTEIDAPAVSDWPAPGTQIMAAAQPGFLSPAAAPHDQGTRAAEKAKREEARAEADRKRRKKKQLIIWISIAAVVIGLLTGFGVWAATQKEAPKAPENTTVPANLVGLTKSEAREVLKNANLTMIDGGEKPDEKVEPGRVVSSDPPPGTTVKLKAEVTVYFSSGKETVAVPDVSGLDQERARKILTEAGLQVGNVVSEDSGKAPKDQVLRTDPAKGTEVSKNHQVKLIVSSGKVEISQDLLGKKKADVLKKLNEMGLSANVVEVEDASNTPGTVVDIDPKGTVDARSTVTITVAKAPSGSTPSPTPSSPTNGPFPRPSPSPTDKDENN